MLQAVRWSYVASGGGLHNAALLATSSAATALVLVGGLRLQLHHDYSCLSASMGFMRAAFCAG